MKFLIHWKMHPEKLHDTLALFTQMPAEQEQALMGNQVQLIGRWHDLVGGKGVAVYEAESEEALFAYAMNWNKFMDLDISVVVDDDQARAIGRAQVLGS